MSRLPLVEGISKYLKENNIYFCMPGHKNGRGFLNTKEGKELYDNFIKGDITEVDGVDNFHDAQGIIRDSQNLLSEYYGSNKSYFLVNGSTSGNLAMIFSAFNDGDKIIVERNCHKSIYNGIIMKKLRPVYIKNKLNIEHDIPFSIDEEHFKSVIDKNKDAKGIIITYPNYYGVCVDLKEIIAIAHKYDMKVLVDSAHGAHFGVCNKLPKNAVKLGADMVVMSAHKTLPSLTQTAFLNISENVDEERVDFYVSTFSSTSPSYVFMASMDYARFYLEQYGKDDFIGLIDLCCEFRHKINLLDVFHVLDFDDIKNISYGSWKYSLDVTRYVINVNEGLSGHKLLKYLRQSRIQGEMSDHRNVVLIFSPFNTREEFQYLYEVLKECPLEYIKDDNIHEMSFDFNLPQKGLYPYEIENKLKKQVLLEQCEGKISYSHIIPYPPGIPIIMPGEIINKETIEYIRQCITNDVTILGVQEGRVNVVEV